MRSDARSHQLFTRHPERTLTLSSGKQFAMPYHCYDADSYVVTGSVDLAQVEALLRGESCHPVSLRKRERQDRGIAQIWLNLYRDTNFGPYRELVITIAVSSEQDPVVFPFRNAASLLLPSADPRCMVFARWLYLDSQPAIDVGREVFGFPKYRAGLSFDHKPSDDAATAECATLTHQTTTADGKEVLRLRLELHRSIRKRLETTWMLMRAFGIHRIASLSRTREVASTILTPTLLKQVVTPVHAVGRPHLYRWSPGCELGFGPETTGGRALAALRFDPALIQVTTGLKFVMLADDPRVADSIAAADEVG